MIIEEPGRTVVRFPWKLNAIVYTVVAGLVAWVAISKEHSPGFVLVSPLIVAYGLLEKRREILISENGVTYRPAMGASQNANFAEVASVDRKTIGIVGPSGRMGSCPGLEIYLSTGLPLRIALEIPEAEREEVFNKIVGAWKRYQGKPG